MSVLSNKTYLSLSRQTGVSLILEYTIGASAISKGFSGYLASLMGKDTEAFTMEYGIFEFDVIACLIVISLTLLLAMGTKESSMFNIFATVLNIFFIFFVLFAAFPNTKHENYSPFFPHGSRGLFEAAGVVFFSYIGFDSLATTAEEVKNPSFDLPVGILTSIGICSILYGLMATAISGLERWVTPDYYNSESPPVVYTEAIARKLNWTCSAPTFLAVNIPL